jgi:hypothetical protein
MTQWLMDESKWYLWPNLIHQYIFWVSETNVILISIFPTKRPQLLHCHSMYISVTSSTVALFVPVLLLLYLDVHKHFFGTGPRRPTASIKNTFCSLM